MANKLDILQKPEDITPVFPWGSTTNWVRNRHGWGDPQRVFFHAAGTWWLGFPAGTSSTPPQVGKLSQLWLYNPLISQFRSSCLSERGGSFKSLLRLLRRSFSYGKYDFSSRWYPDFWFPFSKMLGSAGNFSHVAQPKFWRQTATKS